MNNINDAMKKLQESRDRVAETLPKFIYDLDKDGAWSAREPSKTLGGKVFYKIDRNGSSSLSNDELIKAVLDKFPELKNIEGAWGKNSNGELWIDEDAFNQVEDIYSQREEALRYAVDY